ncbi:hypothetical protein DFH27DRAFT_615662 [Peziza echinospora]|nr:hypothetical protein DFH27DRAFT_615662 [Peziza echinospora]
MAGTESTSYSPRLAMRHIEALRETLRSILAEMDDDDDLYADSAAVGMKSVTDAIVCAIGRTTEDEAAAFCASLKQSFWESHHAAQDEHDDQEDEEEEEQGGEEDGDEEEDDEESGEDDDQEEEEEEDGGGEADDDRDRRLLGARVLALIEYRPSADSGPDEADYRALGLSRIPDARSLHSATFLRRTLGVPAAEWRTVLDAARRKIKAKEQQQQQAAPTAKELRARTRSLVAELYRRVSREGDATAEAFLRRLFWVEGEGGGQGGRRMLGIALSERLMRGVMVAAHATAAKKVKRAAQKAADK